MSIPGLNGAATADDRYILNHMNDSAFKSQLGDKVFSTKVSFLGKYDYSVQGGAISTINLLDAKGQTLKLPANFVITNVILDIQTAPLSSSTANISLGVNSTADILAATSKTALGAGLVAAIPVGTAATSIRVTADSAVTATVTTTALSAGKLFVEIEGFYSRSF